MTGNASLVNAFRNTDGSGLPQLAELDERRQMFWVLRMAQEQLDVTVMTPTEISTVLRDVHGVLVPRQRIEAKLSRETGTVAKRKKGRTRAYQLMASGSQELDTATNSALFIDPERGYTGLREAHSLLETLEGHLRVCDPYSDTRTLDMLATCKNAGSIRCSRKRCTAPTASGRA